MKEAAAEARVHDLRRRRQADGRIRRRLPPHDTMPKPSAVNRQDKETATSPAPFSSTFHHPARPSPILFRSLQFSAQNPNNRRSEKAVIALIKRGGDRTGVDRRAKAARKCRQMVRAARNRLLERRRRRIRATAYRQQTTNNALAEEEEELGRIAGGHKKQSIDFAGSWSADDDVAFGSRPPLDSPGVHCHR